MEKCIIVIPTHSNYLDVCKDYIKLFKKNWSDCPYKIIISITGENKTVEGVKCMYNGANKTLPYCIKAVQRQFPSKYYLCTLGDAFLSRRINNNQFESLLLSLEKEKIDYCSLLPRHSCIKIKKVNDRMRKIHSSDRYSFSFVCFIATKDYIEHEFNDTMTDMDFEINHLNSDGDNYHEYETILIKNEFHIEPGIVKGCWVRWVYRKIKHHNPEIELNNRPMLGIGASIYHIGANTMAKYLPNNIRRFIKKIVLKTTHAEGTDN